MEMEQREGGVGYFDVDDGCSISFLKSRISDLIWMRTMEMAQRRDHIVHIQMWTKILDFRVTHTPSTTLRNNQGGFLVWMISREFVTLKSFGCGRCKTVDFRVTHTREMIQTRNTQPTLRYFHFQCPHLKVDNRFLTLE